MRVLKKTGGMSLLVMELVAALGRFEVGLKARRTRVDRRR